MSRYHPLFAKYYDYLVHGCREAFATEEDLTFLQAVFAGKGIQDVLDAGCGAGRYLVMLAGAGYRMTGVDISPDMLAHCADRLRQRGLTANLIEGDLLALDEIERYDVILCMNSVLCYFLETEAMLSVLTALRRALRPGGVLVLEIWNILANAASFGTTSTDEVHGDGLHIINRMTSRYDAFRSIYYAQLALQVTEKGQVSTFSHEEVLRVMTAGEVIAYLQATGYREISVQQRRDTLEPESGDEGLVFVAIR